MSLPKSIRTGRIAVLSHYSLPALSGWLAERVQKTQAEYTEQYLTGGGRKRMPGHVLWYTYRAADGHVLGYVAANGEVVTDRPERMRSDTWERIVADLQTKAGTGDHADIAGEGLHPAGYDDADHADTGATFHLWERSTAVDVRLTEISRSFTDRHTAYLARLEADDLKNGRHAWITRTTESAEGTA